MLCESVLNSAESFSIGENEETVINRQFEPNPFIWEQRTTYGEFWGFGLNIYLILNYRTTADLSFSVSLKVFKITMLSTASGTHYIEDFRSLKAIIVNIS